MKAIISDYYNTIDKYGKKKKLIDKIYMKQDIKSINKFIDEGNKFIIHSKEPLLKIYDELNKNKMNYSYITCYNGLITIDSNKEIISSNYISEDVIIFIKKYFKDNYYDIEYIQSYNEFGNRILNKSEKLLSIGIDFYDIDKAYNFIDEISLIFKELDIKRDKKTVWIKNCINKEQSIDNLIENIEDLKKIRDNIIILGSQSLSDYTLIQKYGGYGLNNSLVSQYLEEKELVPNVKTLIKKIK